MVLVKVQVCAPQKDDRIDLMSLGGGLRSDSPLSQEIGCWNQKSSDPLLCTLRSSMANFAVQGNKTPSVQPTRNISIFSRGNAIDVEQLFAYTNGHFLVNEKCQIERRWVRFNLDALCAVAARAGGDPSPISAIEKMEGGFSKALLMRKANGAEVIVKIPCGNAGPSVSTTESEVAVLRLVKQQTDFPIPEVFTWCSDPSNPVGAEYIIMEKAAGVQLFQVWAEISQSDKLELIKRLTILERQTMSIQFPAYGSLYLRSSRASSTCEPLDRKFDPSETYCVGHSSDRTYVPENCDRNIDLGPWGTLSSMGTAIAKREIYRVLHDPRSSHAGSFYQGSPSERMSLLECAIRLMELLDSQPTLAQVASPVLWHTDLHMGNIFVSPDEPSLILSVIDWQSTSIMPAFLQSRWPVFLEPPENYIQGMQTPQLPNNLEQLDPDEQHRVKDEHNQAFAAKAYEVSTYLENRAAHTARNAPRVFRELFKRCGETAEMGILPLRACLIEIFQNWSQLGFEQPCPFSFSTAEIEEHEAQFSAYEDWYKVRDLAKRSLDTDEDGWIAPELDIVEKRRQNQELLDLFVEKMSNEKTAEEARRMWPFVEREVAGKAG